MDQKQSLMVFVLFSMLMGTIFAAPPPPPVGSSGASGLITATMQLCTDVKSLMLVAMFLMILLAAITYAVGQMMGAETRARATVWATAMFTGSLFAGIIFAIMPWAIDTIMAGEGSLIRC